MAAASASGGAGFSLSSNSDCASAPCSCCGFCCFFGFRGCCLSPPGAEVSCSVLGCGLLAGARLVWFAASVVDGLGVGLPAGLAAVCWAAGAGDDSPDCCSVGTCLGFAPAFASRGACWVGTAGVSVSCTFWYGVKSNPWGKMTVPSRSLTKPSFASNVPGSAIVQYLPPR